jgi:hypothetical protein
MSNELGEFARRIADAIDAVTAAIGRAALWCCLYAVLAEFAVVLLRYAFGIGSIELQESVLYAHAGLFMLAAAWTLQVGAIVTATVAAGLIARSPEGCEAVQVSVHPAALHARQGGDPFTRPDPHCVPPRNELA